MQVELAEQLTDNSQSYMQYCIIEFNSIVLVSLLLISVEIQIYQSHLRYIWACTCILFGVLLWFNLKKSHKNEGWKYNRRPVEYTLSCERFWQSEIIVHSWLSEINSSQLNDHLWLMIISTSNRCGHIWDTDTLIISVSTRCHLLSDSSSKRSFILIICYAVCSA